MINRDKLKPYIVAAEKGSYEAAMVVKETLRPRKEDTVEQIYEKLVIYNRLIFGSSMVYEDAPFHKEIDMFYAEQAHSYLNFGRPRWKGLCLIGFRESAKTSRVKFGESYLSVYLCDILDYTNVVSEDGSSSDQFNMDMFNTLAFSKIGLRYFPEVISSETRAKKKESQTMSKFTTATNVTYSAGGARKTKRGNVKVDIGANLEVETKRPKKAIFDDIENETTVRSVTTTKHIEDVMSATIDGLDQILGFWILLGNYLSLRGNVAKFLNKYKDDPNVKIIMIPILDGQGNVTWPGKYVATDKEEAELAAQGITRRSVESIERDSDNFDTEYLNNPSRSLVYFTDKAIAGFDEDSLVQELQRTPEGLLIMEQPDPDETYIMSVDVGKGTGRDESSFTIIKTTGLRYEEVANFKSNKKTPEQFAPYSANIARMFNNCLIIPENNYPGNEYIAFLRPIYNNIYFIEKGVDKQTGKKIIEYGVNTNLKTKPEMFLKAKKIFIDKLYVIRSQALYNQVLEYPSDDVYNVKQKDGSGGHFDLLMSAVIGIYKAATLSVQGKAADVSDAAVAQVVKDIFQDDSNYR